MINTPPFFWDSFQHEHYMFCEEQLYSFVREPSNTWSNIGYLVVAILIFLSNDSYNKRLKNLLSFSCFTLFIGSTLSHLTGARFGGLADVSSMFFVASVALGFSFQRFFNLTDTATNFVKLILLSISLFCLFILKLDDSIFAILVLLLILLEVRLSFTNKSLHTKKISLALGSQTIAFIIWILDVKKVVCVPENHILSGHAVWHLLSALTIYLFFQGYKNYDSSRL